MVTQLSHATLFVNDQDKAFEFYVNILGFEVKTDAAMPNGFRWLTVSPPGQPDLEIPLLNPLHEGMNYDEETRNAFSLLLSKGAMGAGVLSTPDCNASYEELRSKGVVFKSPPKDQFYGIEAVVTDGCGNWFSLTQRK